MIDLAVVLRAEFRRIAREEMTTAGHLAEALLARWAQAAKADLTYMKGDR